MLFGLTRHLTLALESSVLPPPMPSSMMIKSFTR